MVNEISFPRETSQMPFSLQITFLKKKNIKAGTNKSRNLALTCKPYSVIPFIIKGE